MCRWDKSTEFDLWESDACCNPELASVQCCAPATVSTDKVQTINLSISTMTHIPLQPVTRVECNLSVNMLLLSRREHPSIHSPFLGLVYQFHSPFADVSILFSACIMAPTYRG